MHSDLEIKSLIFKLITIGNNSNNLEKETYDLVNVSFPLEVGMTSRTSPSHPFPQLFF